MRKFFRKDKGQAMLISVVFFLSISLGIISGFVSPTLREFSVSNVNFNSKKSYFLAESGSEDVIYRIVSSKVLDHTESLTIGSNTATTTFGIDGSPTAAADSLLIESLGDVNNFQRQITSVVSTSVAVPFYYGVQVGDGGINLIGSGTVNGNVFSNGPITGDSSAIITGSAISAGATGNIAGNSGSQWNPLRVGTISGSANAARVNYVNATGDIYCQNGVGNNKSCLAQSPVPSVLPFPVTDALIDQWKAEATAGGLFNGNYVTSAPATIGPTKIVGNLTVSGGRSLTISGVIWVTGNLIVSGAGTISLSPTYGSDDGLIIVDGTVSIGTGGQILGSGTTGSYIMIVTTSSSGSAITVSGGAGAAIVVAPYGTINVSGGASLKEATGFRVIVSGGSSITYETGIVDSTFVSGPATALSTWGLSSWRESQ